MSSTVINRSIPECSKIFKNISSSTQSLHHQGIEVKEILHSAATINTIKFSNQQASLRRSYASLVNLIEQHQKLDRTTSEPTSRYKTELCRPFEEHGSCKYGDKCQFAHGINELRNLARHPKYKTELCRTFHKTGFCPYGLRCHFVHNFEEARIHNLKVSAQLTHQQKHNQIGLCFNTAVTSLEVNLNLFEQLTSKSNMMTTITTEPRPLLSRSDLFSLNPFLISNIHSASVVHAANHRSSSFDARIEPHYLPPTFSLISSADSVSPLSSLSQSPTDSITSFFNEDLTLEKIKTFSLAQENIARASTLQKSRSQELVNLRASSPLSPGTESRLPVFNQISNIVVDPNYLNI